MSLLQIVDFLGFMFILIAAFLISSKYVANPKVRIIVFNSYFIACFFLITWGWMASGNLFTWFTLQQTVLMFINIRGIYIATKEIGGEKPPSINTMELCKSCKVINCNYNYCEDYQPKKS